MSETPLPDLDVGSPSLTGMKAEAEGFITLVRRYAALSGPFAPVEALRAAGAVEPIDLAITVSSALDAVCDVSATGQWLLRASERAWDLKRLNDEGSLRKAIEWRRDLGADPATADLLDALLGKGAFSPKAMARRLVRIEAQEAAAGPELRRLATALEWSGALAPAAALLARLQAALNRTDQARRGELLLADGFQGRERAVETLTDWIRNPDQDPIGVRALYVSGLPAIGKSTLLEHVLRQVAQQGVETVVVRLDFDRASLDVLDQLGLSVEVARQVASQLPSAAADLRQARLEAITTQEVQLKGGGRSGIPYALIQALAVQLQSAGRRLVMVLDTLEVLRGRGETHPRQLFDWLDQLARAVLVPLVVVAAGRGRALEPVADRVAETLDLDRLTDAEAERLLSGAEVPPALWTQVIALAEGDPLQLRLLATLARDEGQAGLTGKGGATITLYRSLEARLGGRHAKLARFIPLFRRLNSALLGAVMAPVVLGERLSPGAAAALWAELKDQTWLIAGETEGWLTPQPDLRRRLAGKLYDEHARRAGALHRRAARWFAERPEPWAGAESLYHRLQATRWAGPDALKGMNLAAGVAFQSADLEELPEAARDALLRARGERSYEGRGDALTPTGEVSPAAADELRMLISKGDLAEASHFYGRVFRPAALDPTSPTADVALTLLWRTGRWTEARRLAAERAWTLPWDHALFDTWPEATLVRLEMQAEFNFADLLGWFRQDGEDRPARAARLIRSSRNHLGFGALAFALDPDRLFGDRANPPAAVLAMWTPDAPQEGLNRALATAHERRQRIAGGGGSSLAAPSRPDDARTLAILSPYGDLAEGLLPRDRDGELLRLLRRQLAALPEAASGRLDGANPASALSALGFTAEWLSAAGLLLRDPDLRLIGRSAERWRAAAAGRWRYARRSPGWRGAPTRLDVVIEDRLTALFEAPSPIDAARAQLAGWAGDEAGVARVLRSAKLDAVRAELAKQSMEAPREAASRAAWQLLRRWIPAAFVSPLAILAIEPEGMLRS